MEWLIPWLPKFGGVVKQAEDELSAINMAIGAALTGTRTMTAPCGPGIAVMQEGIGHLLKPLNTDHCLLPENQYFFLRLFFAS